MKITFDTAEQLIANLVGMRGELKSRLHGILDTLDVPSYATDAEGFVTYFNQACTDFFGRTPVVGRDRWNPAWKLFNAAGDYIPHDFCPMAKTIKSRRPARGITLITERPDHSRVKFVPLPTPLFDVSRKFSDVINILVPVLDEPGVSALQAQAERSRRLRFSVVDDRIESVFGQVAAEYEARIRIVSRAQQGTSKPMSSTTLGDVLYAKSKTLVTEDEWDSLVKSVAAGDQSALQALYERAHPLVSTLITKITDNPEKARDLAVDVFHDVWRRAARYDSGSDTVVGWIMTHARGRAVNSIRPHKRRDSIGEEARHRAEWAAGARDAIGALPRAGSAYVNDTGAKPILPPKVSWSEPEWETVAAGIECKLLAIDAARHRVSLLVRLGESASYPAHTHSGVEELHLLDGELWIDDRKLLAGEYNYGAPGTGDNRVFSETGCTCVLITSTQDILR
jgi:PAS domain-containing protein